MKRFVFVLSLLCFVGFNLLQGQGVQVTGNVTSADDGSALPGVSIVVKGTTIGAVTDFEGNYSITIPDANATLMYSFVGTLTQEIGVAGRTVVDVLLVSSSTELDEVVVTALGISRDKKGVGYATTEVSGKDIADAQVINPMNALQGRVAGVDISSAPGPGGTQNVLIRGASSFGNNQPLYVVDGVPIVNTQNRGGDNLNFGVDFGSGINALNPDDIESMTILKGAAATALYGSRAANGVILITSKKGKDTGGKMNINYDGSFSLSRIGRIPERQDSFGQGWSGYHALDENGNWGSKYTGKDRVYGYIVDNSQMIKPYEFVESRVRDFYDLGQNFKNSLSLSGGNEKTTYYVSASQNSIDGVYPGAVDVYDRTTLSTRGEHKWKSVTISSSVNWSSEEQMGVPSGQGNTVFRSLWEIAEDYSVVDMADYNDKFWNLDNYFTPYGVNPYFALNENGSKQNKNKLFGKVQVDWNILESLRATYRFGGDYENSLSQTWIGKIDIPTTANSYNANKLDPGSYSNSQRIRFETNHEAFLNFTKTFGKFDLDVMAGLNINERSYRGLNGFLSSLDVPGFYTLSNGTVDAVASQAGQFRRLWGVLGNVDMNYDGIYYLTISARNDHSSTLPLENNSYFYPGATASIIISELLERYGSGVEAIDFAKLRVAYGWTGNDAPPNVIYPDYVVGGSNNPGYPGVDDLIFPLYGINSWMVSNSLGSPDLAPEITKEFEVGADMVFFQNRLGFEFSYYNKVTEGLISGQPLDPSTGYTRITSNIGDVQNIGVEVLVYGSPVRTNTFEWSISANYSQNKNEVLSLAEGEIFLGGYGGLSIVAIEGEEMGLFKAQVTQKVDVNGQEKIVVDGAGIPIDTPDEVVIKDKSINEKFRAGLTNSFRYKGLTLSATLDLRYGGYIYSYQKDYMGWTGSGPETVFNDRNPFVVPNSVQQLADGSYVENSTPVATADLHTFYSEGAFERAENFLLDRSYLKLRDVRLTYELPSKMVSRIKLSSIRVSLIASNILLWTPTENRYIDPETTTFGNDISAKFGEFGAGPTNQVYSVALSLAF